jgi:hypothetical protein
VPKLGTVKAIRLEAPTADLFRRVSEARLRPCIDELPHDVPVADIFPFTDEQVLRIARTEPTLRDMLQQCRHLFDHLVYGPDDSVATTRRQEIVELLEPVIPPTQVNNPIENETSSRIAALLGREEEPTSDILFKHVEIIEASTEPPVDEVPMAEPVESEHFLTPEACLRTAEQAALEVPPPLPFPAPVVPPEPPANVVTPATLTNDALAEMWEQEQRAAFRKIEPEGALTGATRELQAGLGAFLSICLEHGVKVGPWRLQHVVPEWPFGEHPTYGAVTIAHWACKDSEPWKVGLGLFLARGAGKPKDLEVKLAVMDAQPVMVDHLILLRPEDDLTMTGKSKTLWLDAERRGKHARLEPVSLDGFAQLYAFPRWLAAVCESLPEGTPLPNLADVIQEKCEKLLEQVCMPVQG